MEGLLTMLADLPSFLPSFLYAGDGWKQLSRLPELHQAVHGGVDHRSEVPQASEGSDGDHELQEPLPFLRLQLPCHRTLREQIDARRARPADS